MITSITPEEIESLREVCSDLIEVYNGNKTLNYITLRNIESITAKLEFDKEAIEKAEAAIKKAIG